MLSLFTKYLVQYGKVCIPGVGTFELVCQSPQFDVADQLFRPPFYITRYHPNDELSEHQFYYFASSTNSGRAETENEIISFGEKLKKRIEHGPFQWNGFGTLRLQASAISFEAYQINLPSLPVIPAHKMIRENARHHVLVGDQHVISGEESDAVQERSRETDTLVVIGWVVLVLAIIGIAVHLYLHDFKSASSGLSW